MNIKVQTKDFTVPASEVTEIAQKLHNEFDVNGEIDEDSIVATMVDHFCEIYEEWLHNTIDWEQILEDDRETLEDIRESIQNEHDAIFGTK